VQPLAVVPKRITNTVRIALIVLAVAVLFAVAFALGRATTSTASSTTTVVRPTVVQPAGDNHQPALACHLRGPC
jgi:hypothetical protein